MTAADDVERCRQAAIFRRIDAAFRAGDFDALYEALDRPDGFPNVPGLAARIDDARILQALTPAAGPRRA